MSQATRATSAKERAAIALRMMKTYKDLNRRTFGDCFEMGDGDEVYGIIMDKVRADLSLLPIVKRGLVLPPDLQSVTETH